MGNYLIYLCLALFTWVWSLYAGQICFKILGLLKIPQKLSEKSTWNFGIVLITLGLLFAFALMGISLTTVLSSVFSSSQEVSQNGIAIGILASLCLSWILSLSKFKTLLENKNSL